MTAPPCPDASRCVLACRVASYRPFEHDAYEHLAALGVTAVEIRVPPLAQLDEVAETLARHGLRATTLHAQCDVTRADVAIQIAEQIPAFERLKTALALVCIRTGDVPLDVVYRRLREAGAAAADHGVTLAVETHPDIAHNADAWLATVRAVDHPAVRLNFDTANIHFYNEHCDAIREIERVAAHVAAVHLKDTNGGFRQWHFPALGRGIVDFRNTLRILEAARFAGPLTLEIEGREGEQKTAQLIHDRIAESVRYMHALGYA